MEQLVERFARLIIDNPAMRHAQLGEGFRQGPSIKYAHLRTLPCDQHFLQMTLTRSIP
jgi:hypothetical protein